MKVGLAQIDCWVGDLEGNVARCVAAVGQAAAGGAELVVLPELAVTGYPPRDLLFDDSFVAATLEASADLADRLRAAPPVVVGTVARAPTRPPRHPGLHNVAALLEQGRVKAQVAKRLLPAYDVFHEPRWFLPGEAQAPVEVAGRRVGVLVCEDLWDEGYAVHPPADLRAAGAELLVCLAALPFRRGAAGARRAHARRARAPRRPRECGGSPGRARLRRSQLRPGRRTGRSWPSCPPSARRWRWWIWTSPARAELLRMTPQTSTELHDALVLGIRGFAEKNRLGRAFLGLSGGIDSALVARLAVDALGPDRVSRRRHSLASHGPRFHRGRSRDRVLSRYRSRRGSPRAAPRRGRGDAGRGPRRDPRRPPGRRERPGSPADGRPDGPRQPAPGLPPQHQQQDRDLPGLRDALRRPGRRPRPDRAT